MSRMLAWMTGGAAALVMTVTFAVPSGATGPSADEAPSPPPATDGPTVYADTCAKCHGPDGKGETGMGKKAKEAGKKWPDLTKSTIDAAKAKEIIELGVEGTMMKPYKDKLSAEAIANVRDFVMKLRAP